MPITISSLWLNEGFARYMQQIGAQHIQKTDTGILDRFIPTITMTVMDKGTGLVLKDNLPPFLLKKYIFEDF